MTSDTRSPTHLDTARLLLALLALLGLVCFLYPSRLPIAWLWYDHADTLIMEAIARDLWQGGSLLDWRLTQAPYLFPDVAFGVLLAPALPLGSAAVWIHAIYGVVGAWGWWRLGRTVLPNAQAVALAPLAYSALFMSSVLSPVLDSSIAVYFGLPFHHSGVAAMMPFALLALITLWRSLQHDVQVRFAPVLASIVLLFLLALSDGLFVLGVLGPVAGVFLFTLFRPVRFRNLGQRSAVVTFVGLIVMIVASSALGGRMLVFDTRDWYTRWAVGRFVNEFPKPTLDSIREFARFPFESWFTAALMTAWFIALVLASRRIAAILFGGTARSTQSEHGGEGIELTLLAAIFGGIVVIVADVAIGLFVFPANSRQFAAFLISSLALVPLVLALQDKAWPRFVVPVAAACLLSLFWFKLQSLPREAYSQRYAAVVDCLDREFPRGADFAGDFWLKVPIEFWSQGRFRGLTSTPTNRAAFTNGQNVIHMRKVRPTLAIAAPDFYRQFLDEYGEPVRRVECPFSVVVLDYSNNPKFMERHAASAEEAK